MANSAGDSQAGSKAYDVEGLLETARRAAAAGAQVLAGRDPERFAARTKSSGSDWVTAFDVEAEHAVRAVLAVERPDDAVTGEELGGSREVASGQLRWSIDPLDGTTNFLRDIAYYGTSVGVVSSDGRWLAGVVDAPALGRRYEARAGGGAWRVDAAGTRQLHGPDPERSGRLLGTGFAYDGDRRRDQLAQLETAMADFADVRRIGSAALDLCMVAEGALDGYREMGLQEHDWAAGALIAEEAGCWVQRPVEGSGGATERNVVVASSTAYGPALAAVGSTS